VPRRSRWRWGNHPGRSSGGETGFPPPRGRCRGRSRWRWGNHPGRSSGFPPPRLGGGAEGGARWRWGHHPGRSFGSPPPRGRCRGRSPKAVGEPPGRPGIRVTPGPYLRAMLDTRSRSTPSSRNCSRRSGSSLWPAPARPSSSPPSTGSRCTPPTGSAPWRTGWRPASTSPQNGPAASPPPPAPSGSTPRSPAASPPGTSAWTGPCSPPGWLPSPHPRWWGGQTGGTWDACAVR
jgi:hypothetical protein